MTRAIAFALFFAVQPLAAQTQADSARALDTVRVAGRIDDLKGIARSASEGRVGKAELRARPLPREGELLETVPGVIVTQHSGEGKANQYFVRGFNLDHGTDFQTRLDGMPLNLPTHAHGQGYTDLNFLIPELIDHVEYKLGVSHTDVGDFGSAGAAEFHLVDRLDHPLANVGIGENGFARAVLGQSWKVPAGTLLIAGEGKSYNGPWLLPEHARKFSGVARYGVEAGSSRVAVQAMAYHNTWRSTDQIPLRAVTEGLISRFGQLDTTDGGATQRYSLSATWQHVGAAAVQRANLFVIYSDLALFSNFTYFLDDPVRGDQFSQTEHRTIVGGTFSHEAPIDWLGLSHTVTVGLQTRTDIINGLALRHTEHREAFSTVRADDVRELAAGSYVDVQTRWTPALRSTIGLRADGYVFDVRSDNTLNSGRRHAGIVSPKLSLAYALSDAFELYASGGFGFHSNDARGATLTVDPVTRAPVDAVSALVRSRGAEAGVRASAFEGLRTTLTIWTLALDSELLFVGDAGTTESAPPSRRRGITLANFYKPTPSLAFDVDVSLSHAELADVKAGAASVPGALENVVAAGVTYEPSAVRTFGALRLRHFGAYPLIEDNSQRASASNLVNADVGYRLTSGTRVQLTVLNLLDARANDIQYAYASRLHGETSDGVDDVHFHPAEPRQFRFGVEWRW